MSNLIVPWWVIVLALSPTLLVILAATVIFAVQEGWL
jgi:hypothetical protein